MPVRVGSGRAFAPAALAAFLLVMAPDAAALYLFLDTNGDSARTAEDVLNPTGTTHVTVWLKTYDFKDGTAPECSHGNSDGEHSYSIVFQAAGGTVSWSAFTPAPNPRGEPVSYATDDSTIMVVGQRIPDWDSARIIRLGTFDVSVRRGRPSIEIVARVPNNTQQSTRIATGTWDGPAAACADGLPYGGRANRAPSMTRLADYRIRAGATERLLIQAEDLDGDPLEFKMLRGPSFVGVKTRDPGSGVAIGEIQLNPDSCASGTAECIVEVSDGFAVDVDTANVTVQSIKRDVPRSPMTVSSPRPEGPTAQQDSVSPIWLVGEWEWHHTRYSRILLEERPALRGYRRRLIFSPTGEVALFEVGKDRILRALRGTYRISHEPHGLKLTMSTWFHSEYRHEIAFSVTRYEPPALSLYPWETSDASAEIFVRVPGVRSGSATVDTSKIVQPVDVPSAHYDGRRTTVRLSASMWATIKKLDPAFQVSGTPNSNEAGAGRLCKGPSAIVGDFDGDMLRDAALLGVSGADQVVVAVLSNFGNFVAKEVAWRRARSGEGINKSRGDPQSLAPISLELAARGSRNRFCWVRRWEAAPYDAVGIVESGTARFDYILAEDGRFVLFAPVP